MSYLHKVSSIRETMRKCAGGCFLCIAVAMAPYTANAQLEEVIVTAQKRAENIQDVAIAVDVVSADTLVANQVTSLIDIQQLSPSVTVDFGQHSRASSVRIRGIGSGNLWSDGIEPSVAVVYDGVVVARPFLAFAGGLGDVERIEVLRGPQGTLFGKNASIGVLNVVTKRPTSEFEGNVDVQYAEDDELRVRGLISGPISDSLSGRLALSRTAFDGYVKSTTVGDNFVGSQGIDAPKTLLQGEDKSAISGKLLWDVSDNLEAYLITEYFETERECCAKLRRSQPGQFGPITVSSDPSENIQGAYDVPEAIDDTRSFMSALELNWDLGEYSLTGIFGYRDYKNVVQEDGDGSNNLLDREDNLQKGSHDQTTFELRLQSPVGGAFDYVVGAYSYNFDTVAGNQRRRFGGRAGSRAPGGDGSPVPGANNANLTCSVSQGLDDDLDAWIDHCSIYSEFTAPIDSESVAIFGQANIHLGDALSVIVGGRYTDDEIRMQYDRYDPEKYRNGDLRFDDTATATNFSGKLGVQYNFSDVIMGYVTWAEGYKGPAYGPSTSYNPGCEHAIPNCDRRQYDRAGNPLLDSGGNQVIRTGTGNDLPIRPEESTSWEIGIKAALLDDHLILNVAYFDANYEDFVVSGTIDPGGAHINFLGNAAEVETSGLEVDFQWAATDQLLITGGFASTNAEFVEYFAGCHRGQTVGCISTPAGSFQDLKGADLPLSPDFKFNLAVDYDLVLENAPFNGFIHSGYSWQDEVQFRLDQNPDTIQESYGTLNFSIGIRDKEDKYYGRLFVENLTDEFHTRFIETSGSGTYQTISRKFERYVGAGFGVNF